MDKIDLLPMSQFDDHKEYSRIAYRRTGRDAFVADVYEPKEGGLDYRYEGFIRVIDIPNKVLVDLVDLPEPENPVYWGDEVDWIGQPFEVLGCGRNGALILRPTNNVTLHYGMPARLTYNGRPVTGYIHGKRPEVQA